MKERSNGIPLSNSVSARGLIPDLLNPHPISTTLPAVFRDDDLACRLTSALDDVLAPVFCVLDNLPAYFDPDLAPDDFVEWLSDWVGVVLDDGWSAQRRRALVSQASEFYRRRGTVAGLRDLVALYTGLDPDISDSGGAAWSAVPGGSLPGTSEQHVTVRLTLHKPSSAEINRLRQLIAEAKPAHVSLEIAIQEPAGSA